MADVAEALTIPEEALEKPAPPAPPVHVAPEVSRPGVQAYTGGEPTPIIAAPPTPAPRAIIPESELEPWDKISNDPRYQTADKDTQLNILNDYTERVRELTQNHATDKKENYKTDYEPAINSFYHDELDKISPFWSIDTARNFGKISTGRIFEMGADAAAGIARKVDETPDTSRIADMSLVDAKRQLADYKLRQPELAKDRDLAKEALKYMGVGPGVERPEYPGGYGAAISAVQEANSTDKWVSDLQKYVDSDGKVVPQKPLGAEAAQNIEASKKNVLDTTLKVDEAFLRNHPLWAKVADLVGMAGGFIGAGTVGGILGGPAGSAEAVMGTAAATNLMMMGDQFQTGYESGKAKADARVAAGEYMSENQREQFALDNATRQAFGTGTWYGLSGTILSSMVPELKLVGKVGEPLLETARANLKNFLLHGTAEMAGQAGIQAGAEVTSNLIEAGSDAPNQKTPWYKGVGEAAMTGLAFGGVGTALKIHGTMMDRVAQNADIRRQADSVKNLIGVMTKTRPNLSNDDALNMILDNMVAPDLRDAVRTRINLDSAAQDLKTTADKIDPAIAPETKKVLTEDAERVANTPVATTKSKADLQAERAARMAALKAQREAEGKAEVPAEITPEKKEVTPEVTPPTPTTEVTPAPGPPSAEEIEETKAAKADRQTQIKQRLAELVGLKKDLGEKTAKGEPIDEDTLAFRYFNNSDKGEGIIGNDQVPQTEQKFARNMLMQLGLMKGQTPGKGYAGHDPAMVDKYEAHFNDWLSAQLEGARAQKELADRQAAQAEAAKAAAVPTRVVPPAVIQDAISTNDPARLIQQLQVPGARLTPEQYAQLGDNFLATHDLDLDQDENGNFFLKKTIEPTRGTVEHVTPAFIEETGKLAPHPHEGRRLAEASTFLASDAAKGIADSQMGEHAAHSDEALSDALSMYHRKLREDALAMTAAGREAEMKPTEAEETYEGRPQIKINLSNAAKTLRDKYSAGITAPPTLELKPDIVSKEDVEKQALPGLAEKLTIEEASNLGKEAVKLLDSKDPKYDKHVKAVWWVIKDISGHPPPKGINLRGLSEEEKNVARNVVARAVKAAAIPPVSGEEAAPGVRPEHPAPGGPGVGAAAGAPGRTPPPHEERVPNQPAVVGPRPGAPGAEAGAGTAVVPAEGEGAPGGARELLQPPATGGGVAGGGPPGGGGVAGGPGPGAGARVPEVTAEGKPPGERTGGTKRPKPGKPTAAAGERTGIVASKEESEPGGPNPTGSPTGTGGGGGVAGGVGAEASPTAGGVTLDSGKTVTPEAVGEEERARGKRIDEEGTTVLAGGEVAGRKENKADRRYTYYDGKGNKYTGLTWAEVNDLDEKLKSAAKPKEAAAGIAPGGTFTTSKGSTYQVHEDGTTTRTKAARPEHPGDEGVKERSAKTVYLTPENAQALAAPQGHWRMIDHGDGTLSLATETEGKWGIAPSQHRVQVSDTPTKGSIPLELWKEGTTNTLKSFGEAHFGNEITDIKPAAPAAAAAPLKEIPLTGAPRTIQNALREAAKIRPDIAERLGMTEEAIKGVKTVKQLTDWAKEFNKEVPAAPAAAAAPIYQAAKPGETAPIQSTAQVHDAYRQLIRGLEKGDEIPITDLAKQMGVSVPDLQDWIKANVVAAGKGRLAEGDWEKATEEQKAAAIPYQGKNNLAVRFPAVADEERLNQANWALADKIAPALAADPEGARNMNLAGVSDSTDLMGRIMDRSPNPQSINGMLEHLARHLGLIDPPRTEDEGEGSGTMNSLVPGVAGAHGFSGTTDQIVKRLRASPEPDMQAFARSLNAHIQRLVGIFVRQNNYRAPTIFYHDGELHLNRAALRDPNGERALAHELQHTIAQEKIAYPQTPEEFRNFSHLEELRQELIKSLPADIRDSLDTMGDAFSRFKATGHLDTSQLTSAQKNWLPVLYAAHSPENFLTASFSNASFRHYLGTTRMGDGRTLLEGVHHWGKTIFGDQAFRYTNEAHSLVSHRPGMPARFNPKLYDLKDAVPLTNNEKIIQGTIAKYGLGKGVKDMLEAISAKSINAGHSALARALRAIVDRNPEIKIGLEDRLGGEVGGYNFHSDRVTVNPRLDDESIEKAGMHEVVHALTVGKITAFETGQLHLLTPEDMHQVAELETLRLHALRDPSTPQAIRDIAGMDTYNQRTLAIKELGNRDPEMLNRYYGLIDTKEFASELLTNSDFQDHLNGIEYRTPEEPGARKQPLLQRLFAWVRNFLGIKEDTVLQHGFNSVTRLLEGGRRVMEADLEVGGLHGNRTMTMQENLLAKRELDRRAQAENYPGGARTVPADKLQQWLTEFREGKALSSREDPYAIKTVADPQTRGLIRSTDELARMTDPRDIIDYLARVTGNHRFDTEAMRQITDNAFKDKALSLRQYIDTHGALGELEDGIFNKIKIPTGATGDPEDRLSLWNRIKAAGHGFRYWGELPKSLKDLILQHTVYDKQQAADEVRRWSESYDREFKKTFKIEPFKAPPKVNEAINSYLSGEIERAPAGWNDEFVKVLDDGREMVDRNSEAIWTGQMVNKDKLLKIENGMGKYLARSYNIFSDPRYQYRPESKQYRAAAEKAVDAWLKGSKRSEFAKGYAEDARLNELRKYPDQNDPIAKAAGSKAYKEAKARAMKFTGKNFLDDRLAAWRQSTINKQTRFMQYGHALNIDDRVMNELTNLPPEVRALMGEVYDPKRKVQMTLYKQNTFINAHNLADGIYELGRKNGYIQPIRTPTTPFQIPPDFQHFGKLRGAYTKPEIAEALTNYHNNLINFQESAIGWAGRWAERGARFFATIGNLPRTIANFHQMVTQPIANGYWGVLTPGGWDSWRQAKDLFVANVLRMSSEDMNAYINKAIRLGLGDKESNLHYWMNQMHEVAIHSTKPMDLEEMVTHATEQLRQKGYLGGQPVGKWMVEGLGRAGEFMTDMHVFGNFASKMMQFEEEIKNQRRYNDWEVAQGKADRMTPEQLEQAAAEVVRDTNISYSQVSPNILAARRNPYIGTFITFAEQVIKSFVMNANYARKGLLSDNPYRKRNGIARLAGIGASLAIPWLMQKATQAMWGVDDKEDTNFRKMLPPWEQHNAIFYGPKLAGSKRAYWNMSYSSQQSDIYRTLHALFNWNNNPNGIWGSSWDAAKEIFRPFSNFGLIPGAVADLYRNQTEYGTQIYNLNAAPLDNAWTVLGYMANREFGGSIQHLLPLATSLGKETVTPGGAVRNWATTWVPEVTGLRINEVSFPERFLSQLYSTRDSLSQAESIFTRPIQRSQNRMTDDQIASAYQKSEQVRQNVFRELHDKINAVRFAGMSSRQIKTAMKARRYSDQMIEDLMRGRYRPYIPSKGILDNARHNGNYVPSYLFSHHGFFYEGEE